MFLLFLINVQLYVYIFDITNHKYFESWSNIYFIKKIEVIDSIKANTIWHKIKSIILIITSKYIKNKCRRPCSSIGINDTFQSKSH